MIRTHGRYYRGKRWCDECKRLFDGKGWNRHVQSHQPGGAPYLSKGTKLNGSNGDHSEAPVFTFKDVVKDLVPVGNEKFEVLNFEIASESLSLGQMLFPSDPLLWNAFMLMVATELTPDNLRSAASYLEYKAKLLEFNSN